MLRKTMLFVVMVVLLATQLPLRQSASATQHSRHRADTIHTKLSRPLEIESLEDYVKRYLSGKYNPSTFVSSMTEEGYPQLTFSFFEDGFQKNSTLVDYGLYLELTTTSTPAFGEQATAEGDQTLPELSPEVGGSDKMTLAAVITKTCGGLTSTGNPYDCCNSTLGNCTFAAWEMAKRNWNGQLLPNFHNAGLWFGNARTAGYPTSPTPALFSIAVSQTLSGLGHVGMVKAINGSTIVLEDQQCGVNGLQERQYQLSYFSGYILNPAVNNQSMAVNSMSPQRLYANTQSDQQVLFSVSNIQGNLRAIVTFPSGYRGTLVPSSQIWVYGYQTVGTRIRLGERGRCSIQFFNTNGVYSPIYNFQVN